MLSPDTISKLKLLSFVQQFLQLCSRNAQLLSNSNFLLQSLICLCWIWWLTESPHLWQLLRNLLRLLKFCMLKPNVIERALHIHLQDFPIPILLFLQESLESLYEYSTIIHKARYWPWTLEQHWARNTIDLTHENITNSTFLSTCGKTELH